MIEPYQQGGFSLIELLLVLLIVSIFITFAVPSLRESSQRLRASMIRGSLEQAIQDTRIDAMSSHRKTILCGSADNRHCISHWEDGWLRRTPSGKILETVDLRHVTGRLHFRLFPRGRFVLAFLSSGLPEAENGTFWYCPAHWQHPAWAIVLNRFGRLRRLASQPDGTIRDSQQQILSC